jgi:PAS domain S-box-containing protein
MVGGGDPFRMIRRLEMPWPVGDWLWAAYLSAAAALFVVSATVATAWQTPVGLILSAGAVMAVAVGIYLYEPEPRGPWLLLAAGQLLFALGDLAGHSIYHGPGAATFPGVADLFYLVGYPIVTLGFARLVLRRNPGPGLGVLLDGGILTVGLALVVWVAFADPLFSATGISPLGRAIPVVYLIADTALIGVVACLVLDSEAGTPAMRLFAGSVVVLLLADGLSASGPDGLRIPLAEAAYFAQLALWAAAALHPSIATSARPSEKKEQRISPRRLAALMAAALVAPAVLALQGIEGRIDFPAISLGSVAIVALVIATMADLIGEQTAAMQKRLTLEGALRETSETLRAILDSSPLPIIVVDRQRRVLFWSRAAEQLFGFTADETQGKRLPILTAEESTRTLVPRVLAGESMAVQELPCQTKDGQIIRVRAHFASIRDEFGKVRGAISLMEDTSEVELLEAQLFEARKLESVGRLAGGIAHDFNNILTAVIGYADLSLDEPTGTDISEFVVGIRDAAERAAGLTQQLLAFSRRQILQPQVLDVNEVVGGLESMLRRLIGEQIVLRIAPDPAAGCLRADRTQLEQVLLNLALNSRDAMPSGGQLVIGTGHQRYTSGNRSRPREIGPGEYAVISVTDTGLGMDAQTRDHIFEPFFTTKGQGRGTGLGLATTYGIIKQSEGSVLVDSTPGRGTTFRLFFPSVEREAAVGEEAPRPVGRRTGRILLVEDEPVLREIAQRVLVRAGFDVTAAADPGEAIIAAETGPEPFDLLLTDVVMPGMRGPELARRLRNSRPDLRVLLASGYAEEIVDSDRHEDPLLAKPFSPETLLAAVDAVMGPEATVAAPPDDEATETSAAAPIPIDSIPIEVEEEKTPAAV